MSILGTYTKNRGNTNNQITMKTEEEQDGTIIEFLLGEKSFQGIWFGDINPNNQKQFWWRMHLREYMNQFRNTNHNNLMKTSEEFYREKLKEIYPNEPITLSQINITAEQGMRWAHEFASHFKTVEEPLRNLLAILHRDGGHYAAKHGLKKAIEDAGELIHKEWISSEFKTVEPENREKLLKEIMDTDQEHGVYQPEKKELQNLNFNTPISFVNLLKHGFENGANIINERPWNWKINGKAVTHETDTCYIIETIDGFKKFTPNDILIAKENGLEIWYNYSSMYNDTHAPGACPI